VAKKQTAALERGGSQSTKDQSTSETNEKPRSRLGVVNCEDYPQIKSRALDLIQNHLDEIAPDYTVEEMCRRENSRVLRNSVGAALCQARDEIRSRCFKGVGMFLRAQREICSELREIASWTPVNRRQLN